MSKNIAGKVAAGAAVGLIAGLAVGVLMAPAKGTVTRRKVGREAKKLKKGAEKQYKHASKYAHEKYDGAKSYAKGASRKAKSDLKELNDASEPLKDKLRELMENSSDYYSAEELDKLAKKAEKAIDDVSKNIEKKTK